MISRPLSPLECNQCRYIEIAPINAQIGIRIAADAVGNFLRAFERSIARHPRLRMSVECTAGRAVYHDALRPLNIRHIKTEHPQDIQHIADSELNQPIPLHCLPLLRVTCITHAADSIVILTFCHLVIDGRSMCALVEESLRPSDDQTANFSTEFIAVDDMISSGTNKQAIAPGLGQAQPYTLNPGPVMSCRSSLQARRSATIFSWARAHGVGVTAMLCTAIRSVMSEFEMPANGPDIEFMIAVDGKRYAPQAMGIGNYATTVYCSVRRERSENELSYLKRIDHAMKYAVSVWCLPTPPDFPVALSFPGCAALVSNLGAIDLPACVRDIWLSATGGDMVRADWGAGYSPHLVAWTFRGALSLAILYRAEVLPIWGSPETLLCRILTRLEDIAKATGPDFDHNASCSSLGSAGTTKSCSR